MDLNRSLSAAAVAAAGSAADMTSQAARMRAKRRVAWVMTNLPETCLGNGEAGPEWVIVRIHDNEVAAVNPSPALNAGHDGGKLADPRKRLNAAVELAADV